MEKKFSLKQIFRDVFPFAVIACVLFFPLIAFKLNGWNYQTRPEFYIITVSVIIGIRLLISIAMQIGFTRKIINKYFRQKILHPGVAEKQNPKIKYFLLALAIIAALLPFAVDSYIQSVLITALIYVLLSLGLNIVVGFAGLLDLGYVAFYAVGAYTVSLTYKYWGLDFWLAMPLAAIIAALFGMLLGFPVLRLHGDYLAIVTLGFGEIIRLILNNWLKFTNGPNGIRLDKPYMTIFGKKFSTATEPSYLFGIELTDELKNYFIYITLLILVIAIIYFCVRLKQMPLGRTWEALREDEIASRSLGINHVTIKLAAFSLGAFFGGIGGSYFAAFTEFINPSSFTFIESALIVAIVVLGGLGSIPGVVVAAIVLTILPEILRDLSQYRILIFGFIMVVMMIWRPRGLTKVTRPKFEKI